MAARTTRKTTATTTRKTAASKTSAEETEPTPNKFRGKCTGCGELVGPGEGILNGKTGRKWNVRHSAGECTESASASEAGATVDAPVSKFENKKKGNTMAAAKKTTARRTTAKRAATKPTTAAKKTTAAPAEPKKRATRKATKPTAPAPVESASEPQEEEDDASNEVSAAVLQLAKTFVSQIESGNLDEVLGMVDEAIGNRLDVVEAAKKPTPRSRKSTTTTASKGAKLAPVSRSKGSASASTAKPQDSGPVKPRKGYDYLVTGNSPIAGQKVKFKSYKPGTDNKRASVELLEEFNGKPAGTRALVFTSKLRKIED